MPVIETFVFFDLETTGVPEDENNKTRITELSFVAVKRHHILDTISGKSPRVQHKLTLCLNPMRMIAPGCTEVTGLCNELLEYEPVFNMDVFHMIDGFLNLLTKPVCVIAHNGYRFDFPILKNHLVKLGVNLSEDLYCADCLHGFYDLDKKKKTSISKLNDNEQCTHEDQDNEALYMKKINETTPKRPTGVSNIPSNSISKVCRKFPWSEGEKPWQKYKLKDIYARLLKRPAENAHRAENDCIFVLECFVCLKEDMLQWIDNNCCLFSEVRPMVAGKPVGE